MHRLSNRWKPMVDDDGNGNEGDYHCMMMRHVHQ